MGSGDSEGKSRRGKVCTREGDGRVDEDAVVGRKTGAVPCHCDEDVRITRQGLGESEGDDVNRGRVLGIGKQFDVSGRYKCESAREEQKKDRLY